jgi:uncharacterized protein
VAPTNPDRSSHFPAIEKKYGQPMSYWFDLMKEVANLKYPEQIGFLRENYGFSQAHANALVLYSRGNTTSKRFNTLDDYLDKLDGLQRDTIQEICDVILKDFPGSEVVIAWNQPMIKRDGQYLFGMWAAKNHITVAPWGGDLNGFEDRLQKYVVKKKTFQVPNDWKVDRKLLRDLIKASIATN